MHRANTFRQQLKSLMRAAIPRRAFAVSGSERDRQLFLTFDDGPHPEHTPRLLDVLGELGVQATFFVMGRHAIAHPEIVQRASREGHLIANHSFSHSEPSLTSALELGLEIFETNKLLEELTGQQNFLFRPPKGKLTPGKLLSAWGARQAIVLWNHDPRDYECQSGSELAEKLRQSPPKPGSILLLHDTHPHAAEALPELVKSARSRGLEFSSLGGLCGVSR